MDLLLRNGKMPQIKHRPTQFEQGKSVTLPAPYGGLNLRDDITALKPNEARVLENWFPGSGELTLRDGFEEHGTGMGSGEVKTLAGFVGLTTSKLVACANGKIFDTTSAGAASELATGLTEDRWQHELYNNRLIMVNGADAPRDFNGSAIASTVWSGSGLTIANLVNVGLSRNRLWFCENNSADVWYAAIGAITGALTKFQLSQIAEGGICMAIGSWSRDSGVGADDVTVFVMSTGEIIIYEGDPASTFNKIGSYRTGAPPVGRHCIFNVGGELVVITRLGLLPVSAAIGGVALDLARIDPWGKIAPGVVRDALLYGGNAGWHGVLHEGVVYCNVPQTVGALSKQRVLNTRNGSWTDFTKWNGSSFASFNNDLYFGAQTGGTVYKVTGDNDNGEDITAYSNGAFVTPSGNDRNNVFTSIRPKMQAEGNVSGVLGVDTDYVVRSLVGDAVNIVNDPSTTPWGSEWGSPWGSVADATPLWYSINGQGRSVAVKIRATGQTADLRWFATDLLFRPGGIR
jgi:hypothetical protein